jgi:hypothetical protein
MVWATFKGDFLFEKSFGHPDSGPGKKKTFVLENLSNLKVCQRRHRHEQQRQQMSAGLTSGKADTLAFGNLKSILEGRVAPYNHGDQMFFCDETAQQPQKIAQKPTKSPKSIKITHNLTQPIFVKFNTYPFL